MSWSTALKEGVITGCYASVTSAAVLAACGRLENRAALGPVNAVSHWIWGDKAAQHDEFSLRHTVVGYAIHHVSSTFWAVIYEKKYGQQGSGAVGDILLNAAKIAALACFTDYKLTPHRLQPGYEMRLSKPSLFGVYTAFGIGLATRRLLK